MSSYNSIMNMRSIMILIITEFPKYGQFSPKIIPQKGILGNVSDFDILPINKQ